MSLHRIFGSGQPYPQSVFDDGTPNIRLSSLFYLLAGQTWRCVGGRVHVPSTGPASSAISILAWTGAHESPIDLGSTPLRAVESTTPPAGGWVEVEWEPFDVVGGATAVAIGYEFVAQPSTYIYAGPAAIGDTDPIQAIDGSPAYFAEQAYTGGRSRFKIGAGAAVSSPAWYGSDIVLDDGLDPEPEPVELFWNDAGEQRSGRLYYNPGTGAVPVTAIAKGSA